MGDNEFIAWTAFALFVLAVAVMVLMFFSPALERYVVVSSQVGVWVVGTLALLATATGFLAFKRSHGKIAALGGLFLLIAIL